MTISEDLLYYILDYYPGWGNSPERFLEFISITMRLSELHAEGNGYEALGLTGTEGELASIFIEVFHVDLHPYNSFEDLQENVQLDIDLVAVVERMKSHSQDEDSLYELIETGGLQPSTETVLDELSSDYLTRSTIEKLRPYIHFR